MSVCFSFSVLSKKSVTPYLDALYVRSVSAVYISSLNFCVSFSFCYDLQGFLIVQGFCFYQIIVLFMCLSCPATTSFPSICRADYPTFVFSTKNKVVVVVVVQLPSIFFHWSYSLQRRIIHLRRGIRWIIRVRRIIRLNLKIWNGLNFGWTIRLTLSICFSPSILTVFEDGLSVSIVTTAISL